jgi:hypothetical protein
VETPVSTSAWRLYHNTLDERASDYTMTVGLQNVGTGKTVAISLTQDKDGPASDLVGALRALTILLTDAATKTSDAPPPKEKLN